MAAMRTCNFRICASLYKVGAAFGDFAGVSSAALVTNEALRVRSGKQPAARLQNFWCRAAGGHELGRSTVRSGEIAEKFLWGQTSRSITVAASEDETVGSFDRVGRGPGKCM